MERGPRPDSSEPAGRPAVGAAPVEPPPVLGSWPRLYALVIGVLALIILFCGWLSRVGR
jgi:hypothetical protein